MPKKQETQEIFTRIKNYRLRVPENSLHIILLPQFLRYSIALPLIPKVPEAERDAHERTGDSGKEDHVFADGQPLDIAAPDVLVYEFDAICRQECLIRIERNNVRKSFS